MQKVRLLKFESKSFSYSGLSIVEFKFSARITGVSLSSYLGLIDEIIKVLII